MNVFHKLSKETKINQFNMSNHQPKEFIFKCKHCSIVIDNFYKSLEHLELHSIHYYAEEIVDPETSEITCGFCFEKFQEVKKYNWHHFTDHHDETIVLENFDAIDTTNWLKCSAGSICKAKFKTEKELENHDKEFHKK
ncbi:uncharacterized protein KGF55_004532 [Candida pseudojiufengensis]|uniref:uncharacterized protein n=1 Tax=Candida pseudojiufengensis TaxID=497109 RepID=UPI00222494F3|nr:uncharacterized protein KGF55_004532 [Candida pseudojiufengensis]KAI5960639.1 hypothetical protein KGF55_004532 [Candida pseudojiufengensis]